VIEKRASSRAVHATSISSEDALEVQSSIGSISDAEPAGCSGDLGAAPLSLDRFPAVDMGVFA